MIVAPSRLFVIFFRGLPLSGETVLVPGLRETKASDVIVR